MPRLFHFATHHLIIPQPLRAASFATAFIRSRPVPLLRRAREEDRSLLMQYLDARLAGQRVKFPLPLRRFRKLNIVWENSTLHFDDKVWPSKNKKAKTPSDIEIMVKPSALVILQPGR